MTSTQTALVQAVSDKDDAMHDACSPATHEQPRNDQGRLMLSQSFQSHHAVLFAMGAPKIILLRVYMAYTAKCPPTGSKAAQARCCLYLSCCRYSWGHVPHDMRLCSGPTLTAKHSLFYPA